jgi:ATP-dependent Clp protease protease subunit
MKREFVKFAIQHLGIPSLTLENYSKHCIKNNVNVSLSNFGKKKIEKTINGYISPTIIEERQLNIASMDVFSRLMMDRIIFLGVPIDDYVANIVQAQLLFLESVDHKKDIQIYLNTPGGSVYAGLGIYDTMQYIQPNVATICTGLAASMGAVLLCAGQSGKRSALTHSRVMIHQPMGGAEGQETDIQISAKQIGMLKKELYDIISKHSGQKFTKVSADSDRDYWMTAKIAKDYGMIDEILVRK